ncbi:MAG: AGE family epimerase/isomerase [Bdellovibrionota bacterium]
MKKIDPQQWLAESVIPLWLKKGLDKKMGGFVESLSHDAEFIPGPRRCMVQARQIYSMEVAVRLKAGDASALRSAASEGAALLLSRFSCGDGSFRHSIAENGAPLDGTPDLYGQAFALFGLAEAFSLQPDPAFRARAKELVAYLRRERSVKGGGFTEIENGKTVYRSNPHMHLFEAALAWQEHDPDPEWRSLAGELLELCLTRFIDPASGALGEYFTSSWDREMENGRFVYEPGHLCEWSWLMGRYQQLCGQNLDTVRKRLFDLSENTGLDAARGVLIDQVWSGGASKLRSARFWPQCERIKAASQLGRASEARAGMASLFRYFDTKVPGLWNDTCDENGSFRVQPVKSSSLYHIIGAISEYSRAFP